MYWSKFILSIDRKILISHSLTFLSIDTALAVREGELMLVNFFGAKRSTFLVKIHSVWVQGRSGVF